MAINLDRNLLDELGLAALPEPEKAALLNHIYETLEMRVGMRLADQMSNEQLEEFEKYFEAKDDTGAFRWLETNFPNYKDIVQEEFNKLKEEVRLSAPQIIEASQAQSQLPAQPMTPQPFQGQPTTPQQPYPGGAYPSYPPQAPPQVPPYEPPQQPGS